MLYFGNRFVQEAHDYVDIDTGSDPDAMLGYKGLLVKDVQDDLEIDIDFGSPEL